MMSHAQGIIQNLRVKAYVHARDAWWAVDVLRELSERDECLSHLVSMGVLLCRRGYSFRPCARVGLRTKPFHTARTRKVMELRRVGRIKGGHKRVGINDSGQWFGC